MKQLLIKHTDELLRLSKVKKPKDSDISEGFKKDLKKCFEESDALDIGLFGRMLADLPDANKYAACQVAHAISTHRVEREFDYFTAVDDFAAPSETGANMVSYTEFNSATFYRYAVIDARKLLSNLQGDVELTQAGISAFAQALALALPTGKQNSFAAHNRPAFIGAVIRHECPFNLANSFEKPVMQKGGDSFSAQSVLRLAEEEQKQATAFGSGKDSWAFLDLTGQWPESLGKKTKNLAELLGWLREQVQAVSA